MFHMNRIAAIAAFLFAPTAHAQWETRTVGGMDSRIYTPASTSPIGDGHALMIVLHGCSQSADQLQDHGNFEATADAFGMVIALPNVPLGGVIAGCWDYYGPDHARTGRHDGALIDMTEALRDDATLDLDPAQLYMVGFSAGAGEALVMGCLAPELYAGVGVAAGPGLGTTVTEIPQVSTTGEAAAALCQQFAGSNAAHLTSQVGVSFTDTNDLTVAQGYAMVSAEMFGNVFGPGLSAMSTQALDVPSLAGASPSGTGTIYADDGGPRVVWIQSTGVGHAWPSGSGEPSVGLAFVSGTGLNFSMYLAEFFTANNQRAEGDWDPGDDSGGDDDDGGSEGGVGDESGSGDDGSDDDDDGSDGGDDGDHGDEGEPGGSGSNADPGEAGHVDPSGCQCRSVDSCSSPPGLLLLLLLTSTARRRSRRCAR
jgi:poly(3-hydroxybutyrate) depolymerase